MQCDRIIPISMGRQRINDRGRARSSACHQDPGGNDNMTARNLLVSDALEKQDVLFQSVSIAGQRPITAVHDPE
jgi:hypothetical protein